MHTQRRKRLLLGLVTGLFWFAQYVYRPFLTPHLQELGFAAQIAGVIVGAYGLTQMILRVPLGILADMARKHSLFITLGLICSGGAGLLMMLAPSALPMILGNGLAGVASSAWICFTVLFSGYYPPGQTARAIATINSCNYAGVLCGSLLGGAIFETYGMKALYLAAVVVALLGAAGSLFVRDEPVQKEPMKISALFSVMGEKRLWFFSLMAAVSQCVVFATVQSFTSAVARDAGASGMLVGLLSALYTGCSILSAPFISSSPARRLGHRRIVAAGFALLAAYCALTPFAARANALLMLPLQCAAGFGNASLFSLLMAGAISEVAAEKKATAMGFFQSVYSLGMTAGPVLMGQLIGLSGRETGYLVIAALAAVGAVMAALLMKGEGAQSNG